MLIKIQPTTLPQFFCELALDSKVIFKSTIDLDDTCQGDLQAWQA